MPDAKETAAPAAAATTTVEQTAPPAESLLDQIVAKGRFGAEPAAQQRGRDLITEFLRQVMSGEVTGSRDVEQMINDKIADIDHRISKQLNEVLHHPSFQKLEASWRGLKYVLDNSEMNALLKVRVLNCNKNEILRDLGRNEFDQSALFRKVYEEEYGVFGGEPFGALIGDFEFSKDPKDIDLLDKISRVAAAAHAPFLTAAAPEMLSLDNFANLGAPRDIGSIFVNTEYAKWKSFRDSEDSRYVGLCLPHILMRLPYGEGGNTVDGFNYEEKVDGTDHSKYLWGNAAYALGARLTNAFSLYGWCAAIRGVEGGGLVEGLPTHNFRTDEGDVALKCPTEIAITDRREKELADNGFIPLVHCKGTDYAAFFSVQSAQKPKLYNKDEANANARLSAQLPYIFAVSRFAHYLKSMMRDKIGSFMSRDNCERFLNKWIATYVIEDDDAGPRAKSERPLREARIDVTDVEGKPGAYRAIAYLRPHFQLDELSVSLRLVADLPQPQGR